MTIKELALQEVVKDDVQPGYPNWQGIQDLKKGEEPKPGMMKGVSWCNRFAERVARMLGYDTRPMLDEKYHNIGYSSANTCYAQLCKASTTGEIPPEITAETAQAIANLNLLAICAAPGKYHGHLAIVVSDKNIYDKKKGPRIVQAGGINGEFYVSQTFVAPGIYPDKIKYFLLNKLNG